MVQQEVGFANQLHVTVFDAVVNHFDIVTGTAWTNPFSTRNVMVGSDFGGDRLKDWLNVRPGGTASAGHQAGSLQCTLFASRYTAADKQETSLFDLLGTTFRVQIMRVTAVDQDIPGGQQRHQLLDNSIHGRTCLDQHHHNPRRFKLFDQLFEVMAADKPFPFGAALQKLIDFVCCAIVNGHTIPTTLDIERQVFAHHSQADQAKIELFIHGECFSHDGPANRSISRSDANRRRPASSHPRGKCFCFELGNDLDFMDDLPAGQQMPQDPRMSSDSGRSAKYGLAWPPHTGRVPHKAAVENMGLKRPVESPCWPTA